MKAEQEYINDLKEIRSMMERSTRFLSLTGWSGIMAGVYALTGAFVAYTLYYESNEQLIYNTMDVAQMTGNSLQFFLLAAAVLVLAVGTAIFLSWKKSAKTGEKLWNAAARRLAINLMIPLVSGGVFILILFSKGLFGLIAPVSLIFYGLALVNASKFTFEEVKYFGMIEIVLGLIAAYFIGYGLLFWAIGFGFLHIVYGVYMHLKYER
tara:strand:+ start:23891 stop:24517 length:627 start_codon:yes stop_codon:yes gene_type:complete